MRRDRSNPQLPGDQPPEWRLLLACARTRLSSSQKNEIESLAKAPLDWKLFLSAAERHKLECLVYGNLLTVGLEKIPQEAATSLEKAARQRTQVGLMYAGRLIELVNLFDSAGIKAIPYKGVILGVMAYGNLSLRSFQDLDFILPQSQILDAARLLISRGFKAFPDPTVAEQAKFLNRFHPGQYAFVCESKPPQVELHTERTLRYLPVPLDWGKVSERFIEVPVGARKIRTFSVEDTLLLLSVHGTKHFWERLSWICDIAELMQASPRINWELGQELARQAGCSRMWLLALSLANRLLDAPLPDIVQSSIDSDSQVEKLGTRICARLASDGNLPGAPERLLFRLRSYEKLSVGLSQCFRTATSPTEEDWRTFRLPDWAASLYFAVRPWRLLREHGFGFGRKSLHDTPTVESDHSAISITATKC